MQRAGAYDIQKRGKPRDMDVLYGCMAGAGLIGLSRFVGGTNFPGYRTVDGYLEKEIQR